MTKFIKQYHKFTKRILLKICKVQFQSYSTEEEITCDHSCSSYVTKNNSELEIMIWGNNLK